MSILNFFRRDAPPVIVVSGLPRSGTSMMMQMLEAANLPILTDYVRASDANNPHGYYEYEPVKRLHRGDNGWIAQAEGKVVKVVSALLTHLPASHQYRVLFMDRDLDEILRSQRAMLARLGRATDGFDAPTLRAEYAAHLQSVYDWLDSQANIETLRLKHHTSMTDPLQVAAQVNAFLDGNLPIQRMAAVVDPHLYRERAQD